jgi:hypothetical protein
MAQRWERVELVATDSAFLSVGSSPAAKLPVNCSRNLERFGQSNGGSCPMQIDCVKLPLGIVPEKSPRTEKHCPWLLTANLTPGVPVAHEGRMPRSRKAVAAATALQGLRHRHWYPEGRNGTKVGAGRTCSHGQCFPVRGPFRRCETPGQLQPQSWALWTKQWRRHVPCRLIT